MRTRHPSALRRRAAHAVGVVPDRRRSARQPARAARSTAETAAAQLHNDRRASSTGAGPVGRMRSCTSSARTAFARCRPRTLAASYRHQEARLAEARVASRARIPATGAFAILLAALAGRRARSAHAVRGPAARCGGCACRGDNWFRIRPEDETAQLPLRFNRDVGRPARPAIPLTVVWSSARHGKHMKSRPPVETRRQARGDPAPRQGAASRRLRRYPGDWKGFFYLDGREVGNATARVG